MAKKKDEFSEDKALELALNSIKKHYGAGSIFVGGENVLDIEKLSSGCLTLDKALGGGYPLGRIVEIYGPESSGKSTLALHAVAEAQKQGKKAAYIDAEHALDLEYAAKIGVDTNALIISQPDSGEQALNIADVLVRSKAVAVIVIDSVAALVPQREIEGEMGDSHVGLQARLMSQALRKLTGVISDSNTLVIFINQIRMKVGVMFGNPETTSGGNALKFYASQRLDIRRIGTLKSKSDGISIANQVRVKVVKNKVAPPFRQCEFVIEFGRGVDKEQDLLTLALEAGLIQKSGAWYSYNGNTIAQGEADMCKKLRENPELFHELKEALSK